MIPAPTGNDSVRLLLVDDQVSVRRGLKMRLALEPDLWVVGEAEDGAGAIALAKSLRPDVILMDVRMPNMDGISATEMLRTAAPESAVVILSLYDDSQAQIRAREAGAAAFVSKQRAEETLLPAIRRAASGMEEESVP